MRNTLKLNYLKIVIPIVVIVFDTFAVDVYGSLGFCGKDTQEKPSEKEF